MWLSQWLSDPHSAVRSTILAEFQKSLKAPTWPTVRRDRTIAELLAAAENIAQDSTRKAAENTARLRTKRLAGMAADPSSTLRETERLVKERSRAAYTQISTLLAELRELFAGTAQSDLAEEQAEKLKSKNPTLRILVSELRDQGFLTK